LITHNVEDKLLEPCAPEVHPFQHLTSTCAAELRHINVHEKALQPTPSKNEQQHRWVPQLIFFIIVML
jgi:hypothetical protein